MLLYYFQNTKLTRCIPAKPLSLVLFGPPMVPSHIHPHPTALTFSGPRLVSYTFSESHTNFACGKYSEGVDLFPSYLPITFSCLQCSSLIMVKSILLIPNTFNRHPMVLKATQRDMCIMSHYFSRLISSKAELLCLLQSRTLSVPSPIPWE